MEDSGADQKSPSGCKSNWGVRWMLDGGGMHCNASATVDGFLVPSMLKPTRRSKKSFKKTLPEQWALVQQKSPEALVELWAMDEHRIGLKPFLRRVWAPKGTAVRAVVAQRYQWMYVYGFVHPQSGQTSWLLMPS